MLHTTFQAPEPSGSEEKLFLNIFPCISLVYTQDPRCRAILEPGTLILTNLIKDYKTTLYTKFLSKVIVNQIFVLLFSIYFYGPEAGPPGAGPF